MAKPMIFYNPRPQFLNNTGGVVAGGKLFFYTPGTTTKKNTYTDNTLGTANPNPIILDSAGRPSNTGTPIDIYFNGSYKVVLAPSTDTDPPANAYWTVDNVTTISQQITTSNKSSNYTTVVTDRDALLLCDTTSASFTLTLLPAATAGNGFVQYIKKTDSSTHTVTIQANAAETIDGNNTRVILSQYDAIELICDGTNWWMTQIRPTVFLDVNGNTVLTLSATASAVNYVDIKDAATTTAPTISSKGSDTNIDLNLGTKGTGAINIVANTGNPAVLNAKGADTNIDLDIVPKGTGLVRVPNTGFGIADTTTNFNLKIVPGSALTANRTLTVTTGDANTALKLINGSPINSFVTTVFTATGTYTPTTGAVAACVRIVAGGGGSAGCASATSGQSTAAPGGGAGEYAEGYFTIATLIGSGTTAAVTIGAAGAAGASGANAGTNGGNTTVVAQGGAGSTILSAIGGVTSGVTGAAGTTLARPGGLGGTGGTGGYIRVAGGNGGYALAFGSTVYAIGGKGGQSVFGIGGLEIISGSSAAANPGTGYGAGAGGGVTVGTNAAIAGAAGTAGLCIITEYIAN